MDELTEKVLRAKEERYQTQQQLNAKYQLPIVSFTLVLPGGFMNYPDYQQIFNQGVSAMRAQMKNIIHESLIDGAWGPEGFWIVNENPQEIKKSTVTLEETKTLGRLWDLDVFDQELQPISRVEIGYPERKCLLCNENASTCYRTRRHSLEEIQGQVQRIIYKGLMLN